MRLCEDFEIALEQGEAVFQGVPLRRGGEPAHTRRLFKLNGVWFEANVGAGLIHSIDVAIVDVDLHLPRSAVVKLTRTERGNVTLDDAIVQHRHFTFGNHAFIGNKFVWNNTALDDGKPWVRPGTSESLAISEYNAEVQARRREVERVYDETMAVARGYRMLLAQKAREERDRADAEANPAWGSW